MKNLESLKNLLRDESGQDLIEYALIAALLALGSVVAIKGLAGGITTAFTGVTDQLNNSLP
jgi:pilus assembly protein Flp/PilA